MSDPFFFKAGLALLFASIVVGISSHNKPGRARIAWACFALGLTALVFA